MSHPRNPHALFTPTMHQVVERIARAGHVPLHAMNPVQARAAYAAGAGVLELPTRQLPRVQDLTIPARDGTALPARLYASSGDKLPVLLYLHGGGFTVGSVATHDVLCRELAHHAHCAVVSLDYRLAPEHQFPTAANDAWDALQWLSTDTTLGLDTQRLALGGDSAGGTLALVCSVWARDALLPVKLQVLFYPGCAAHQDTPSHHTFAKGFVLEEPHITYFFKQYIRDEDRDDWRFAPLHIDNVEGLAPVWMGLAECDPLVDEGVMMADQLRLGGVAVDLEIYRGVVHEFIKMGRVIPEAKRAHQDAARALKEAFDHAG